MPRKKNMVSHSKILRCIVTCLECRKYPHVLYWNNRDNKEFNVKFMHRKNPLWNVSYLDLFKELDGLSKKKLKLYLQKPNYCSDCKVRCKSNLKKLCDQGVISVCGKDEESKSEFSICYKINDSSGINLLPPEELDRVQKQNNCEMSVVNNDVAIPSHSPWLSDQSLASPQDSEKSSAKYKSVFKNSEDGIQGWDSVLHTYATGYLGFKKLINEKSIENNSVSLTSAEDCLEFTNKLINEKNIENIMIEDNYVSCTSAETCSGSANKLINKTFMENALQIENDVISHTFDGICPSLLNRQNMNFDDKLMLSEDNSKMISNVENYEEPAEYSFYQGTLTRKDSFKYTGMNGGTSNKLGIAEESCNINNLVEQAIRQCDFKTDFFNIQIDAEVKQEHEFFCLMLILSAKRAKFK